MLMSAGLLPAQDLHVYYNLFSDSITYQKDGKLVTKPKIRKGDFLILHFTEFNPYLYEAEVDIDQSNSDDWAGGASVGAVNEVSATGTMMDFLGGTSGDQGPMSFLDIPLLRMGESSLKLADLFGGTRGTTAQQLKDANVQLAALAQIQAEMAELHEAISTMDQSERAAQLASQHLDDLLHNPYIRPTLIRDMATEYLDIIFPDKKATDLRLNDAFNWQKRPAAKRRLLSDLQAKQEEFDAKLIQLAPIAQELSMQDQGPELDRFAGELRNVTNKTTSLRQELEAYLAQQSDAITSDLSLEEMMALQMKFRELAAQSFSYDVAIAVARHNVIANARFIPLDSLYSDDPAMKPRVKTKVVQLQSFGGLRINTGFGVGFARMFDPAQEFNTHDNTIVADDSGIVQPALSTYIHFYPNTRGGMAMAGTFGLGIPISSANITALNFFLGPSLLFGRGQRIVLSGGFTAGPTQRLAKGFKEGDWFDPNLGDIPTSTKYELGYFLGISFNMN